MDVSTLYYLFVDFIKSPYSGVVKAAMEQRREKAAALWGPNLRHKEQNMKKTVAAVITLGMALTFGTQAKADAWYRKTFMTVHQPVQVPGAVLEPGKYEMKVWGSNVHRNVVQISDDAGQVRATLLTVPSDRQTISGDTHFTFLEVPKGEPLPIHKWFYPGDTTGHEFLYHNGFLGSGAKSAATESPNVKPEAVAAGTSGDVTSEEPMVYAKSEPSSSQVHGAAETDAAE